MSELSDLRKKIYESKNMFKKCDEQKRLVKTAIRNVGTINALAAKLGVSRNTIARWVSGKHRMRSDLMLELLKWTKEK
jgi:transposase-like protein